MKFLQRQQHIVAVLLMALLVLERNEAFVHPRLTSRSIALPTTSPLHPSPLTTERRKARFDKSPTTTATTTTSLALSLLPHDLYLALQSTQGSGTSSSRNWLEVYSTLLQIYPLATKAITAAILAFIGDAIAQYSTLPLGQTAQASNIKQGNDQDEKEEEGNKQYDLTRGLTFLLFGALYTGAFQHVWFDYLTTHIVDWGEAWHIWGPQRAALPVNALVNSKEWWSYFDVVAQLENPPTDALLAVAKVTVNQFVVIPTVYMPLFFFVTGNFNISQALTRAQNLYFKLLRRNYVYWLPVQFAQFFWLPAEWQIPFVSAASLVWTVVLSSIGTASASTSALETEAALPQLPQPVMAQISDVGELSIQTDQVSLVMSSSDQETQQQDENNDEYEAARDITEQVSLDDVREAFVPGVMVSDTVSSMATGFTIGLVASAADDAALGAVVGSVVGGAGTDAGVAVTAAMGAGIFLLGSLQDANKKKMQEEADLKKEDTENVIDVSSVTDEDFGNSEVSHSYLDQGGFSSLEMESDRRRNEMMSSETSKELVSEER